MAVRTDFVAGEVLAAQDLDDTFAAKVDYALPVNTQTGTTYTFVLADGLRLTTASNASASTFTIPPQSSVVWLANSVIRLVNFGAGVVTFAGGSGVTVTNAAKTLAQFESAACIRTGSNAWTVVPFSGAVGNADFSNTATGTYTDGGINYKYVTFNASGTLTITKDGYIDALIVSGGGGGGGGQVGLGCGSGGAGGMLFKTQILVEEGQWTITVGGGGAGGLDGANNGTIGTTSRAVCYSTVGGGFGGTSGGGNGGVGGSGGGSQTGTGGAASTITGNALVAASGNAGGNPNSGGGGGAGGAGSAGAGGVGLANSITGTSVTYAAGGTSTTGSTVPGTANTGNGGQGKIQAGNGSAGGSGVIVIRVQV